MDYNPSTEADLKSMLNDIGVKDFEQLVQPVPQQLRNFKLEVPPSLSEPELLREMQTLAANNTSLNETLSFLGAGAYEHFIPSIIDHLSMRGEFYTAYTPYQPEASQGTLQAIYEYQSLICQLTAMEVSNASLYDGASALAEAAFLAINNLPKRGKLLISAGVHPEYRQVLKTYSVGIKCDLVEVPLSGGVTDVTQLRSLADDNTIGLILQTPNFVGNVESASEISQIVHHAGGLLISVVNPISLGIVQAPGEYAADIVCGEGQPLGIPIGYGGPWLGFLATTKKLVHKICGRLVGRTVDLNGEPSFCLTLQAREQHIRREKATSNICTNQSLMALRAAIYLSWLGPQGLRTLGELNLRLSHYTLKEISKINGFAPAYPNAPFFNEFVVQTPVPAQQICDELEDQGIVAGLPLSRFMPGADHHLLVCVTETKSRTDIDRFIKALQQSVKTRMGQTTKIDK